MTEAAIVAQGLGKDFAAAGSQAKVAALAALSLEVPAASITALVGPDGAGKSTFIRLAAGLLRPDRGALQVLGLDVARQPQAVQDRIGYMPQRFGLYEDLSVQENLSFYAGIYGVPYRRRAARVAEVLELTGLVARRKQIAGTLSGGWKQRVALASATIHQPPLLFLDEPTAGVDPVSRRDFWAEIHRLAAGGTTVLVTTHYMDEAERCHRLAFIFAGRLLDVGRPDEIVERAGLSAAEIEVERSLELADALTARPEVVGVEALGHRLRIVTRGVDPITLAVALGGPLRHAAAARVSVEDAFVSMVRGERGGAS